MIHFNFSAPVSKFEKGKELHSSLLSLDKFKFVEEFTFEDWKNDKIPPLPQFYWHRLSHFTNKYQKLMFMQDWVSYWAGKTWDMSYNSPLISKEDYDKIREEQYRVYKVAVKIMSDALLYNTEEHLKNLSLEEQKDYIDFEISSQKESLSGELYKQVIQGITSHEHTILPFVRDIIIELNDHYEKGVRRFITPIKQKGSNHIEYRAAFELDDLFEAHYKYDYLKKLEKLNRKVTKSQQEVLEMNSTEKLVKVFVWDKFDPKAHSKQMIEDYLKRWERNQGASFPRKVTIDKLQNDYPKLAEISGSVIKHWEDKWKKFRDTRTEN